MPRYRLNLHDGEKTAPAMECVDLDEEGDALDLAQIALLSTARYTHAEVYRGDCLVGAIKRDSYIASRNNHNAHSEE